MFVAHSKTGIFLIWVLSIFCGTNEIQMIFLAWQHCSKAHLSTTSLLWLTVLMLAQTGKTGSFASHNSKWIVGESTALHYSGNCRHSIAVIKVCGLLKFWQNRESAKLWYRGPAENRSVGPYEKGRRKSSLITPIRGKGWVCPDEMRLCGGGAK